jgi:Sec-independent protein translocase protein TatA
MSIFELLVIVLVCFLVIKPEDIPIILAKIKKIKAFIFETKQEIMSHIDPESSTSKKSDNVDFEQETDQMNFYLGKIANLGFEYEGQYTLESIKKYYQLIIKQKMKNERKNSKPHSK